jgi:hypothetical protein
MKTKLCSVIAIFGIVLFSASPGNATTYAYTGGSYTSITCFGNMVGSCPVSGPFSDFFGSDRIGGSVTFNFDTSVTSGTFGIPGSEISSAGFSGVNYPYDPIFIGCSNCFYVGGAITLSHGVITSWDIGAGFAGGGTTSAYGLQTSTAGDESFYITHGNGFDLTGPSGNLVWAAYR